MKNQEENLSEQNTPYQCNFVLIPRKEKVAEQSDLSGPELNGGCFSLEKRIQR